MSKPVRRPGSAVYYAQRAIPKELRDCFGKREIWQSLHTKDFEAAKPLKRRQQLAWDEAFVAAREKLSKASAAPPASARWLALSPQERAARVRAQEEYAQEIWEHQLANPEPDYEDLSAEERARRMVTMADFEDAKDKIMMGAERKSMVMTDEEKRMTAYHEGGHALVALTVPNRGGVSQAAE